MISNFAQDKPRHLEDDETNVLNTRSSILFCGAMREWGGNEAWLTSEGLLDIFFESLFHSRNHFDHCL